MKKKKILHLITGLEIGGTEMMLLRTIPFLQKSFDNHICCIVGHGPIGKQLELAGIPVYYLELKHLLDFTIIWRFWRVTKKSHPDILITYLIHADLFGRLFGKLYGIKSIICNQRGKLLQWEFLRSFDRITKFLVTKYIVQTETAKQELMKKLHLPEKKLEIIPNMIDSTEFDFIIDKNKKRLELRIDPNDFVITCVSKLRRGKGHEYLLEAFEQVFEKHKHAKLLIVGDGEQKEKLVKQIESYRSRSKIYFLGNRSDVNEILKISDIFTLPTFGEGMSNALLEAMASGLPIITTDIPENRELIKDEVTGLLVTAGKSKDLAQAITQLINDKRKCIAIGSRAKQSSLERFSPEKVVEKYRQILERI